jgi:hypothetical protein
VIENLKKPEQGAGIGGIRKPIDIEKPGMTSPGFQENPAKVEIQPETYNGGMKGRDGRKEQENAMIARQAIERRRAQHDEELRKQQEMQNKPIIPPTTVRPGFPGTNNGTMPTKPTAPKFQQPDSSNLQRQNDIQNQINLQRMKQQDALRRAQIEALQRQNRPVIVPQTKIQSQPSFNKQEIRGSGSRLGIRGTTQVIPTRKMPGFTPQVIAPQKKPQN